MSKSCSLPSLPKLLERKIYKSGQTRGADDDVIYQNRVGRTGTVLIPYHFWDKDTRERIAKGFFESGYIVLIRPEDFFQQTPLTFKSQNLVLGNNMLVFYETRAEWIKYCPDNIGWKPASSRTSPLGGEYVARVPATTAEADGKKINRGFTETKLKGAGIRLYEYAPSELVELCRIQLEAEYWMCFDSEIVAKSYGMTSDSIESRKQAVLNNAKQRGLLNIDKLITARIINNEGHTICPLCLKPLSGLGFFNRMAQAEGREVPDLTVTEINLFHIRELRYGEYNHRPYNLGWGHHHCNVVVKDAGIDQTLEWMKEVLDRNEEWSKEHK